MSEKSTRKRRSRKVVDKPKKPYPDFPLTPHNSGTWMKKIRGRIRYFGRWARTRNGKLERIPGDGWEHALQLYRSQADDLHAGRTPRKAGGALTVADLCNRFLTAKSRKMTAGEMSSSMFAEYRKTTDRLVAMFGRTRLVDDLASDDFEGLRADLARQFGPVRLGNEIQKVRTVFKYAFDNELIDRPVRFGSEFKRPGKAVMRRHKASNGKRMLEADEIRRLLDAADPVMRAMILLGVNCGFGNSDAASLPLSAVDLESGWIDFPRPKTGVQRRCPLWAETVAALKAAIAGRPEPKDPADNECIFLTAKGKRWVRSTATSRTDAVSREFGKLAKIIGVHRKGIGFYVLRHVFRTVADGARDPVACDLTMGHTRNDMATIYRESIDDSRLNAVVRIVHDWLFGSDGSADEDQTDQQVDVSVESRPAIDDNGTPGLKLFAG